MPDHLLIDRAHRWLHLLGWSVGEAHFVDLDGTRTWQVELQRPRDGQTILSRAPTQTAAWREACRVAVRVIRGE